MFLNFMKFAQKSCSNILKIQIFKFPNLRTRNFFRMSDRLEEFDEFFKKDLKQKLFKEYSNETECIKSVVDRFDRVIDYNVPHGKKLRGICAYESSLNLLGIDLDSNRLNLNEETIILIEQSKSIGWCIELVSSLLYDF